MVAHLEIEIDYKPNSIWLIFYQFISPITVQCTSGSPMPSGPRWRVTSRDYLDFCVSVSVSASASVSVSAACFICTLIMSSNLICLWHHYCSRMGTNIRNSRWKEFWKWALLIRKWCTEVTWDGDLVPLSTVWFGECLHICPISEAQSLTPVLTVDSWKCCIIRFQTVRVALFKHINRVGATKTSCIIKKRPGNVYT